jgi:gamma-glutamyl hercynylcysteine S-oxide synthase
MSAEAAARGLERARTRTLQLTDFDEAELTRQHDPLMSPLVWDLAHIGQQEDLWLLRNGNAAAQGLLPAQIETLYDAFEHPRAERVTLPLLGPRQARSFIADVRGRVFDGLQRVDQLNTPDEALFPYLMVEQHEQQHVETMLATHQLRVGEPLLGAGTPLPPGRAVPHDSVLVPAGPFVLGVDGVDEPWSLDNERPAHVVELPAFRIARFPVTNAEWQAFIDAGGYDEPRWWSARGWAHRLEAGLERPLFWSRDGARRRFGIVEPIPPDEPVQHVCFFEAEAYAAWAGARLPTEQEWEKACAWDPAAGVRRRWPWGSADPSSATANLGGTALRPAPVGGYPAGASAYGVEQLIGDVWEWTSSGFEPWPGFTPMLYAQYSMPFFGGDFRVLRGGSWAVDGAAVRPSFRNWDLPIRRQIFCGLRLAWDVADV